ncbi:hypothetical protein HJFPF1_11838 [Paramyrothecium foliicola]|nr:hypothetical protein HJFPF1_11838 [Paramyrothecium foliicola]
MWEECATTKRGERTDIVLRSRGENSLSQSWRHTLEPPMDSVSPKVERKVILQNTEVLPNEPPILAKADSALEAPVSHM